MKAKYIDRIAFSDRTKFAYKEFDKWINENPDTEVLNISDYSIGLIRFIVVYFKNENKGYGK